MRGAQLSTLAALLCAASVETEGAVGEGVRSAEVHAELTRALLDHHRAHGARAKRAALVASLWRRFTEHHADIDAADERLRAAFERSAERIVQLNGIAPSDDARAAGASTPRAPSEAVGERGAPSDSRLRYGFTRMAVVDDEAFAARLASWKPLPAELAVDLPRLAEARTTAIEHERARARARGAAELSQLRAPFVGSLPTSFDWSGRGVLTEVKDQRDCGACWSFTTVQTLEAAVSVIGGSLVTLSAQQLLDCDQSWNQACVGGNVAASIGYLRKYGAMRDDDYPYRNAASEACEYRPSLVAVRVAELMRIPPGSEQQLQHALIQFGPLAVSVDASGWQHYSGGVISQCADGGVNHAVQLVGWGTTGNGVDYWNIRNSWSVSWGELGYARLLRGVGCNGIIDEPAYTFAVAGEECIAFDCGRCVGEGPRCGWCAGAARCLDADAGKASCALGWLDASCPPAPPPPRGLGRSLTCGTAAAAATGQPAPYVAIRIDRIDWRQGSACILGYELSATQGVGALLLVLTAVCWLLQALAGCCCCPEDEGGAPRPLRFETGAGAAGAGVPLLDGDALGGLRMRAQLPADPPRDGGGSRQASSGSEMALATGDRGRTRVGIGDAGKASELAPVRAISP
ncbi:hypothetical protein KFE25_009438 [Diacronema lutheri]|uniref:Peptidase C1A papain C-terminal domain-containing protein n=1 Tax=Diacronema lutheri TaxID=2081491 RepID=A0A8J5XYV0_DIALT|nr:hypothetical protein KFE25_009438 [Diacronema lutheri]